ncbi:M48 peptidase [Helicosporidium sp. ATCC 50920]|nr:M48 peptidase [Helicosporidium sp. ATCC 50920]|eukprot:KDD72697.1 M48 peptidase [Helicosporidium sp. ATCC 50920]
MGFVLDLPWAAVRTFGLEARHGFNQTSARTFALDALKSAALGAALLPPLGAGLSAILARSGPHVALQLWALLSAVSLALVWAHPALIAPLFNTFSPLPEGSLRARIEALAADVRFPLKKLFVVDGSARSAHSNAYMFGFGRNKRVVLYDTLLQQCSEDQILAVLAHELGHWKLRHTVVLFLAAQLQLGATLALFTALRTLPGLAESFGFGAGGGARGPLRLGFDSVLHAWLRADGARPRESWRVDPAHVPALAALLLLPQLMGPLDAALGCLSRLVSRAFEYQADAFAADRGLAEDLQAALITLDKENKSAPHADALYSAVHHSHPTLLQRLRALETRAKKRL